MVNLFCTGQLLVSIQEPEAGELATAAMGTKYAWTILPRSMASGTLSHGRTRPSTALEACCRASHGDLRQGRRQCALERPLFRCQGGPKGRLTGTTAVTTADERIGMEEHGMENMAWKIWHGKHCPLSKQCSLIRPCLSLQSRSSIHPDGQLRACLELSVALEDSRHPRAQSSSRGRWSNVAQSPSPVHFDAECSARGKSCMLLRRTRERCRMPHTWAAISQYDRRIENGKVARSKRCIAVVPRGAWIWPCCFGLAVLALLCFGTWT